MGITLKTHKILWGKSGNRCSFPNCKVELVMDESETDNPSVIGQEAHIVGKKINGPRGNSKTPIEERDKYDNLILLCSIHHKLIDDQPKTYTVKKLIDYKKNHLDWVSENLTIDKQKQKFELEYASIIDKWIDLGQVNEWKIWTSNLLSSGQPSVRKEVYTKLRELQEYIFTRHWSGEIKEIEYSLKNFNNVLNDFFVVFEKYRIKDEDWYETESFYKTTYHEQDVYDRLLNEFNYHVDLIQDLIFELTRAGNRIIRAVRKNLFSTFRNEEGVLIIEFGPTMDLSWKTVRTEYLNYTDQEEFNYLNLKDFMTRRETRSYHFGKGESIKYLPERFHM
jgi:hypothetical protein